MAGRNAEKLTYNKALRKLGISSRKNEKSEGGSKPLLSKPTHRKENPQSTFKNLINRSISKRCRRRTAHFDHDRPKSLCSTLDPSDNETTKLLRSASAPLLTAEIPLITTKKDPESRRISFGPIGASSESLGPNRLDEIPISTIDAVQEIQNVVQDDSLTTHLTQESNRSDSSSAELTRESSDSDLEEWIPAQETVGLDSRNFQPDETDSGSQPTQIINLSDEPSEDGNPLLYQTVSELHQALQDLYGPTYKQIDDLAGIVSHCTDAECDEHISVNDFSEYVEAMGASITDSGYFRARESLNPYLDEPVSYADALNQTDLVSDEQIGFTRRYVSAWIFISITTSRLDSLRLMYKIHLLFWLHGIRKTTFSMPDVAILVTSHWFTDASNLMDKGKYVKMPIPRSGCRTGLRTGPTSRNSSKVAAVISGPDQGIGEVIPALGIPTVPQVDDLAPAAAKVDHNSPDDHHSSSSEHNNHSQSTVAGVPLDSGLTLNNVPTLAMTNTSNSDAETRATTLDSFEAGRSTDREPLRDNSISTDDSQSYRTSQEFDLPQNKSNRSDPRRIEDEPYACDFPSCQRRFVKLTEVKNHMEIQHPNFRRASYQSPPPPYRRRGRGPSPESSDFSEGEEQASIDHSLSAKLAMRPLKPLSHDFRVRSPKEAPQFFVTGRVLEILWHESSSPWSSIQVDNPRSSSPNLTADSYGEPVYSHIRRFLVVKARRGYCQALPIYTYHGKGLSRKSVSEYERRRHAIIYDAKSAPERLLEEPPFTKEAIPVHMDDGQTLGTSSRLHFDKPQSIEWNAKVKGIGMVKGDRNLRNIVLYFRTELLRGEEEESIAEDGDGEHKARIDPSQDLSIEGREVRQKPSITWT